MFPKVNSSEDMANLMLLTGLLRISGVRAVFWLTFGAVLEVKLSGRLYLKSTRYPSATSVSWHMRCQCVSCSSPHLARTVPAASWRTTSPPPPPSLAGR
jgi:hypothetical protein